MGNKERKFPFLSGAALRIVGIFAVFLLAVALLWYGNENSSQASNALVAQIYFDGEYRIEDGPWHKIVKGEHISATKGDVTLRGNFHVLAPDGTYVGTYDGETPIALYINHILLTFFVGEDEPFVLDMENPIYGVSACGVSWYAHSFSNSGEEPIEILIHNPHDYGNENAIDDLLSNVAFWADIDFEKGVLESGQAQRALGLLFVIVSLMFLGTALFSTLIHIKNAKSIWVFGAVIFFAGTYLAYCSDGVSFWSTSVVSNTIILGCAMMFYAFFLSVAIVQLLRVTKKAGIVVVSAVGALNGVLFVLPMLTKVAFYDTWLYWAIAQAIANCVLIGCLVKEVCATKEKERWFYLGLILPLVSFDLDVVMTGMGSWSGGLASMYVFFVLFIVAMVAVLKVIPHSINALTKAKELETEKILLNAQLAESRISTMMSQIRPHFIYNTLGSIEQLCAIDPPKAGELVHNFAKYLRGNFGELDNPSPILMSREMEHVRHYVSIENVRFPDMTFSFEMNSNDFRIPALTIQPIVENAIKHGLMKLPKGGTIRVVSYETDTHYCVLVEDNGAGFDTSSLMEDRTHVGIRNIRGRLKEMVNGELKIESAVGVGTKVLITIPKEEDK